RGTLLIRRHVSDAESDRRQGHHRARCLRMSEGEPVVPPHSLPGSPSFSRQRSNDMSATAKAGLALANVLYEKRDGIAYVTVNRPKVLNALNTPTWVDLRKAFEDARDDSVVRGVILTGAGDKAFIAGADISELRHVAAFEAEKSSRFGQEVL